MILTISTRDAQSWEKLSIVAQKHRPYISQWKRNKDERHNHVVNAPWNDTDIIQRFQTTAPTMAQERNSQKEERHFHLLPFNFCFFFFSSKHEHERCYDMCQLWTLAASQQQPEAGTHHWHDGAELRAFGSLQPCSIIQCNMQHIYDLNTPRHAGQLELILGNFSNVHPALETVICNQMQKLVSPLLIIFSFVFWFLCVRLSMLNIIKVIWQYLVLVLGNNLKWTRTYAVSNCQLTNQNSSWWISYQQVWSFLSNFRPCNAQKPKSLTEYVQC